MAIISPANRVSLLRKVSTALTNGRYACTYRPYDYVQGVEWWLGDYSDPVSMPSYRYAMIRLSIDVFLRPSASSFWAVPIKATKSAHHRFAVVP